MAAAPSALLRLPPLPSQCAYRLQSRSRASAPETDDSRVGGTMRGEKNYYCRGAAGDHGSCPPTPSPLGSTLLMPAEAVSSSWSGSGGGLSGGDEEETRLLQLLRTAPDPSEAFQALQAALPRRGGRLAFPRRKEALYRALGRVLVEGGSDEKRLCLQLLSDVLRGQGEAGQLEEAFSLALLPQLVASLREENPALRKDALQILHICLKRSSGQVLRTLIQGLESTDARLSSSTALLLPVLLTPEDLLLGLDLTEVIISLARKLGDQEIEEESETAFSALQQIGERLGQERFQSYISRLPSALRRHYNRRLESHFGSQVPYYLELEASGFPEDPLPCAVTLSNSNLKFGIIPQELHSRLLDQEDYKNRTQAVEELKHVLGKFSPSSTPYSSLVGFISLLYHLLDDSNFKVVHGALQVLHLLVIRLGEQVQQFLGPVIAASVKVLADNKLVIKQEYMKIFLKLMKEVGPQQVLCLLLEHLKHKHSRVREEVVNICICSLLTYPSEDFDLPKLSFDLAPALVDSKRRVRQAALEAFAVLASSMGSGKTSILFKAVDTVEMQDNGDGVMNAVQARLARKTLPRLTEQGFVEYAVLMPSSAQGRSSHLAHGADTDWLLAGNRTQSAHCHCGDHTRDSMQMYGSYSPTICTRRVLSAGKGKNKLPWENEQPGIMGENQTFNSKDVEQLSAYDFISSPKLKPSPGMPVNDDLCFNRKRVSRNLFQNSRDFNPDSLPVCAAGVFGSPNLVPATCNQSMISSVENGDTFSIKQNIEPPSGIYGRAVQQSIPSYLDVENEKETKVSISKSTYDKMRQKRKEEKELFDIKDCEKKDQNPWERMKHTGTEKMISESEASSGTIAQYKERMHSVTHSPEIMDSSELRPFSKPEIALTEALRLLADEDCHLHIAVRRCTAQHLTDVVEFMEPERILSGTKDMAERILPAAAKFAQDSSQETRDVTEAREVTRKSVPRNSLESAEYIKVITGLLNAKDFRDRINGIKQLLSDTENNQELVIGNIVKIFDAFKSRLHDSNSKVNLVALETMHKMIPLLRDNLSPIINMLIPAIVDNNLNSKNPGIYAAATNVVQALSQHVGQRWKSPKVSVLVSAYPSNAKEEQRPPPSPARGGAVASGQPRSKEGEACAPRGHVTGSPPGTPRMRTTSSARWLWRWWRLLQ
ncbi:Protein FAM179B [Tupaia chinensis]|uniref:Protein FAM179B n=1 Tax=Tupaia chinensis TaxID=246437 RepID=L9JDH2_TUPCH|nr:Protein FAM179B [Tupaia chinensis]